MKRLAFTTALVLFLIFCFTTSAIGEEEAFTFRNGVCFGMTMEEVKETEKDNPDIENEKQLFYVDQKAAGKNARLLYSFGGSGLESIGVIFTELHTNPNAYFDDYDEVYDALCKKYGEPYYPKQLQWKSDLFKDQSSDYGILVAMGHLQQFALWDFPEYRIGFILKGENYEIFHGIVYEWKAVGEQQADTTGI